LEILKEAIMSPTKKPPAPSSTAYTGIIGQMIPRPIIATPTETESKKRIPEEDRSNS
jgi:hypothetical protein